RPAALGDSREYPNADRERAAIDYFLAELPGALGVAPGCIAFLVDTDRYAIYNPRLATAPKEAPQVRDYFVERARRAGFAVSDLGPVFRTRYAENGVKFDFWPADRHWNRVGHGVAAAEAYRLLFAAGNGEC